MLLITDIIVILLVIFFININNARNFAVKLEHVD